MPVDAQLLRAPRPGAFVDDAHVAQVALVEPPRQMLTIHHDHAHARGPCGFLKLADQQRPGAGHPQLGASAVELDARGALDADRGEAAGAGIAPDEHLFAGAAVPVDFPADLGDGDVEPHAVVEQLRVGAADGDRDDGPGAVTGAGRGRPREHG